MRYPAALTVPITVTRHLPQALPEQIASQVSTAVDHGLLTPRSQLPSTRTLATLLGVSRGVTAAAYDLLHIRGYLETHPSSGTFVAARGQAAHRVDRREVEPVPATVHYDLSPGLPNADALPMSGWRAAWRDAGFARPPATPPPPLGLPALRQAIADHLTGTRGVSLAGRTVVVTGGTAPGLRLVLDTLGVSTQDAQRVAVEEPVAPAVHRVVGNARPLPVDAMGARTDELSDAVRVAVVCPDATAPFGHVLTASRRRAAAAWAADTGGYLIEVACEAVYRPTASRLPRLSALTGDRGIMVGGFCERVTPVGLGYAVVPEDLADEIARRVADQPSYVTQHAGGKLLRDGTIVRIMQRLGRLYAGKRRLAQDRLPAYTQWDSADTAVLPLPAPLRADDLVAELTARGVTVGTLAPYHFSGTAVPQALVLGFGHLPDAALCRALTIVAETVG